MNDFDFLIGTWHVANRRLLEPLSGGDAWEEFPGTAVITRHFGGAANVDEIVFPSKGFSGLTVRLYDPAAELWSIYWASSARGVFDLPPMVGRFAGPRGVFHGEETCAGRRVGCRFVWTVIGGDSCRWEQAFSADDGHTWETNWTMDLTRA
jgi:hypothetical protein